MIIEEVIIWKRVIVLPVTRLIQNTVGPSLHKIAQRYQNEKNTVQHLIGKVKEGGTGVWGSSLMNPHPSLNENEIKVDAGLYFFFEAQRENSNQFRTGR